MCGTHTTIEMLLVPRGKESNAPQTLAADYLLPMNYRANKKLTAIMHDIISTVSIAQRTGRCPNTNDRDAVRAKPPEQAKPVQRDASYSVVRRLVMAKTLPGFKSCWPRGGGSGGGGGGVSLLLLSVHKPNRAGLSAQRLRQY